MKIGKCDTAVGIALVAEVGVNHEGSPSLAREMIAAASEAGADAVKLQTFVPELYAPFGDQARLQRLREYQLSFEVTADIIRDFRSQGITVFSTPFDLESAAFLVENCDLIKISSGDIDFHPLLETVARSESQLLLSTGASEEREIFEAVKLLGSIRPQVMGTLGLLHCVSLYPTPRHQLNLGMIPRLANLFPESTIGFSDHSLGIDAACFAAALGARIIEKHFTTNKSLSDFRDHTISLVQDEVRDLRDSLDMWLSVKNIDEKVLSPQETEMRSLIRRSVLASRDLEVGERIGFDDFLFVRPGDGQPPSQYRRLLGCSVNERILKGEPITWPKLNAPGS